MAKNFVVRAGAGGTKGGPKHALKACPWYKCRTRPKRYGGLAAPERVSRALGALPLAVLAASAAALTAVGFAGVLAAGCAGAVRGCVLPWGGRGAFLQILPAGLPLLSGAAAGFAVTLWAPAPMVLKVHTHMPCLWDNQLCYNTIYL